MSSVVTRNIVLKEIVNSIPTHRLKQWVLDAIELGYLGSKPDYRSRQSMANALLTLPDYQLISLMSLNISLS